MLDVPRSLTSFYRLDSDSATADRVAEPGASELRTIPEKLVSCVWFEPHWRPAAFATLDGRAFTVRSPGQWNRQAGPDFRQAVIEYVDGEVCRGDVEVHRVASGWTAHRHHLDSRYNEVILHVILRNDRAASEIVRADGQTVPQMVLSDWLSRPIADYRAEISLEDYPRRHVPRIGHCYTALRALPPEDIQDFLERAGVTRLQQRAERWTSRVAEAGLAQATYEAVLRSLGAAGYRQPFQALARELSWDKAQRCLDRVPHADRRVGAEALVLGMAGMLALAQDKAEEFDAETQAYIAELSAYWQVFPREVTVAYRVETQVNWRAPHVRPANTPERRLAGMAQLLARYPTTDLVQASDTLCQVLQGPADLKSARKRVKQLSELFDTPEESYWSCRSRFGSRITPTQRLIGEQRALTLVIDALLPLLLLEAQQQGDTARQHLLFACFRAALRLPDNAILRDMKRRLLGEDPVLLPLVSRACHQQGLLQVYEDYCSHDEGDCQGCDFPIQAAVQRS